MGRIFYWIKTPLIAFIIGIILYAFLVWVNLDMKMFYLDKAIVTNGTWVETIGTVTLDLIRIFLIALVCLVLPAIKYGIVLSRILISIISVYWGFILSVFITSNAYLASIYLSVQAISILWCFSIGMVKINHIEKSKLAIIPVILLVVVNMCKRFF